MPLPIVRPILPRDVEPLQKSATADAHRLIYPTHLITRDGQIIGYFSIKPPYVNVWLHTKQVTARDTTHLLGVLEALVAQAGSPDYIMLCAPDSPFVPYLDKLGFHSQGNAILGYKPLFLIQTPQ